MQKGKLNFIKKWGVLRFVYAYTMIMLNRFLGFRISAIRAKKIEKNQVNQIQENGITYRALNHQDFADVKLNRLLDINLSFVEKALSRGDHCVGAVIENKVVGYTWRTIHPVNVDFPIKMRFGEKLYYRYKGFVLPEHRGKNIFNQIKRVAEAEQLALGRTHAFGCIETHNYSSLRASHKHDDSTIGYSAYIDNRFFFAEWSSKSAKRWGISVYKSSVSD